MLRISAVILAAGLAAGSAWSQDKSTTQKGDKKELTAQQQRMKSCNAQAGKKDLKGDERKAFMSECLSADGKKGNEKMTAQQQKMKSCNAQASKKEMKGDARKKFMSECLKG